MTKAFTRALEIFRSGELTLDELRLIKEAVDERILLDTPPHVTSDPRVIRVGGEDINLVTTGNRQRVQVQALQKWMDAHLLPHLEGVDLTPENASLDAVAGIIVELLDADALVRLGMILTGKSKSFVEDNFDVAWIVDGAAALIHYHRRRIRSNLWQHNSQPK